MTTLHVEGFTDSEYCELTEWLERRMIDLKVSTLTWRDFLLQEARK